MKASPLRVVDTSDPVRNRIIGCLSESIDNFNRLNPDLPVTAAVTVLFNDDGTFSACWDTNESKLPATAILGMAARAILHK